MAGSRQIRSVRWCSDDRMTTGKKQPRVVEGSTAGEQGSEAAVGSTHTNPYLFFLDAYQKKAKAASTSRRFKIAQCSKPAADIWNNMSDAERAPFVEMAKERKACMKKPIPKEKKKKALPVFPSRCSPLKLVKVNKALTKAQRDAVKGLGFGSMLQLKCTMLSRDFINRLVKHFNPVTRSLEFGRARVYRITADDVERALGLSCGTIPVPTDCQDRHVEHITNMFKGKEEKELKRGVTFAMMQQVFDGKKHDVKFQTSYVLFVLSCFLCPTTKDVAATKFYPAVHDLKQTRTYAWAEFVLQWLAAEIAKYKKRSAKVMEGKKDSAGVAGCVLLLMLLYFDKHPMGMKYTNAAFHDLKKYFINQMQVLDVMDAALMGDVPETCTRSPSKRKASTKRKNRNEDDVEMGDVHMDVEDIPSTSTVNAKKVRHGEDMDGSRMSGLLFAQNMPLDYVFKMGGGRIHLSHHMLHEVFKPRGHMSTMVMTTMTEWLMKEEKAKAPIKDGVPRPSRHMFSSYFVLFLPVLLTDIEHWYCVVVNLVDKRIEVLDSMALQSTVKKVATVTVVRMLFNVLSRTRTTQQLPTPWHDWHVHEPHVPQQSNTHDCGFYTLKFMEHWTGGRMNTRELEDHVGADPIDVRKRLLVRLLLSPHNLLRDVVVSNFVK
ncbi:hypothetical protein RHMOL_Rhmol10G0046500 [Rhododendron molle]|uniref:Uncharacterized protein n=1 Tax=Rhododendron molle TaxID=49168 RepID=A0ACC0LZ13_RHOML|nr:hypothetical protein RHMOL_Rhmol10G0046500 [Rhododendron molle]